MGEAGLDSTSLKIRMRSPAMPFAGWAGSTLDHGMGNVARTIEESYSLDSKQCPWPIFSPSGNSVMRLHAFYWKQTVRGSFAASTPNLDPGITLENRAPALSCNEFASLESTLHATVFVDPRLSRMWKESNAELRSYNDREVIFVSILYGYFLGVPKSNGSAMNSFQKHHDMTRDDGATRAQLVTLIMLLTPFREPHYLPPPQYLVEGRI